MAWVIVKKSRVYKGGNGYVGSTFEQAGIERKFQYSTEEEAEADAKALSAVNPVGFRVEEYKTEDEVEFGPDAWVYCKSHMRPHETGWCTVHVQGKILLDAKNLTEADQECLLKGYDRYEF